jgi:uncharacterized protein YjbI with pentapeptide repeats
LKHYQSLALALARMETGEQSPMKKKDEFEEIMKRSNEGLRKIAQALQQTEDSGLVLVIDQFEETFSLCTDTTKQNAFIENLLTAALEPGGTVSVLLCLRNDFLDATYNYSTLNQVIANDKNHLIVPVMKREELRQAIQCPAEWAINKRKSATQAFQPLDLSTVNWLIEQAEDREGVLPLLQFALSNIWEGLQNGKEPGWILQEIGGVGGALENGGVEGALKNKADEIFKNLESNEQEIARRIFLGLVQLGEGTKETRRRVEISKLVSFQDDPKLVRQVINRFCNPSARFITLSSSGSNEKKVVTAEVTHEALFEHWPLMKDWINNQRDALPEQRRIEASSEQWSTNENKKGYLLQGQPLKDAERYQKEKAMDLPLSADATNFVEQSCKKRRNDRLYFFLFFLILPIVLTFFIGIELYRRMLVKQVEFSLDMQRKDNNENSNLLVDLRNLVFLRQPLIVFNFNNARLNYARLNGANFQDTKLNNVKLQEAQLSRANLIHTNLTGTILKEANLQEATLNEAFIEYPTSPVNLSGTNLRGAKLIKAKLDFANFHGARLINADLSGASFQNASFKDADFKGAILNGTRFDNAELEDVANLTKSQLEQTKLCHTRLSPPLDGIGDRDCEK